MGRSEKISLKTLHLSFDLPLYPRQIAQWRGAVALQAGWEQDLFHNHKSTQNTLATYFRYPLIQYRSEWGKAAILGLGDGVDALRAWIFQHPASINIGAKSYPLRMSHLQEEEYALHLLHTSHRYRLMNWLPLNQENYQRWLALDQLTHRVQLLEEILTGHILAFAAGVDWRIQGALVVHLLAINEMRKVRFRQHDRIAFNVLFRVNATLPSGIALGRAAGHGFGVTKPLKKQK